jgi:hypothetical protein
MPGHGTAVLARLRAKRTPPRPRAAFEIGAVSIAMRGETHCGDSWSVRHYPTVTSVLVADGLGHGFPASEASEAAVQAFLNGPINGGAVQVLESIHSAIRHTRGAAAAVAQISQERGLVRFSGIGNIIGVVSVPGETRQAVSNNGTLGHQVHQFREYQYPWSPNALLILHSDGLSARWSLDQYPGLRLRDPSLVAAILYRDFSRARDDATVVVAREAA